MSIKLMHTPLNKLHQNNNARMTAFAGYDMPLQYENGIMSEHLHTRSQAGLFDVSHMGQIVLRGNDFNQVADALETSIRKHKIIKYSAGTVCEKSISLTINL